MDIKFFDQIEAIGYNNLWFVVTKEWRQEGKGVQHPFAEKRLHTQLQATEKQSITNGNWIKITKKKQQEMNNNKEEEYDEDDPLLR